MFVQVIRGRVTSPEQVHAALNRWSGFVQVMHGRVGDLERARKFTRPWLYSP